MESLNRILIRGRGASTYLELAGRDGDDADQEPTMSSEKRVSEAGAVEGEDSSMWRAPWKEFLDRIDRKGWAPKNELGGKSPAGTWKNGQGSYPISKEDGGSVSGDSRDTRTRPLRGEKYSVPGNDNSEQKSLFFVR